MSKQPTQNELILALQQSAVVIQKHKKALAAYHEPIAIIGMGCRYPGGADTPERFWQNLLDGLDAIIELPDRRAQDRANGWATGSTGPADQAAYLLRGGFLQQVDQFDPAFFRLSPREVLVMDPAHRLLLETTWQALEDANIVPAELFNTKMGVFIGGGVSNYIKFCTEQGSDLHTATGNAASVAAGRLSYVLGITGPSVSIDTACSSSLTAIHLACQSLRNGECNAAVAGGVNLILDEEFTAMFANGNMLAGDARCKTFDAAANGYVRGEGCGIIILKRLSDARANHDHILAAIRGTAINQDGPSGGLTVPNGPSQENVIRRALKDAGLKPEQITYIEAHGTATPLGDPIEIGALSTVFKERTTPLYVGSVKTNIGHLEMAAGVAGLMKLVLSLQHGQIPPHLHLHTPNPHIDWQSSPVQVPTSATPWPRPENARQRIGGVSSFGFSGTNAHVIVAEAPVAEPKINYVTRPAHLLTLSAKSAQALQGYALRYHDFFATHPEMGIGDLCYTSHLGRSHFAHRLTIVADSLDEVRTRLVAYANGNMVTGLSQGTIAPRQAIPKVGFLFTGQGAQYVNMGRELYETQPTFRTILDRCDELLEEYLDESLVEIFYTGSGNNEPLSLSPISNLDQTTYTQPALFALEYALATLWQSWGIQPDVLIGHSVGELAAACVAGVFSLEDGLKLVAARGRLMGALPQDGEMVSLLADEARVQKAIAPAANVSIAAVNGPESVVISGKRKTVLEIAEQLAAEGVKTRQLTVSHAFHSPLMEPMLDEFRQVAASITYHKSKLPFISNVTGQLASKEVTTPEYWVRHIREAVRFADGVATLHEQGIGIFLEIGPKPTLLGMAPLNLRAQRAPAIDKKHTLNETIVNPLMLPSLRENQSDWHQMLESLGELYVRGVEIDWEGFDKDYQRRKVVLPTYPFQRQRYWSDAPKMTKKRGRESLRPLIDKMVNTRSLGITTFETTFTVETLPFLADYRLFDTVVLPSACHLAFVLDAAELALENAPCILSDVVFPDPLVIPEDGQRTVQLIVTTNQAQAVAGDARLEFNLVSFDANDKEPSITSHTTGRLNTLPTESESVIDIEGLHHRCIKEVDLDDLYQVGRASSIGPTLRWLTHLWYGEGEALGKLAVPAVLDDMVGYRVHPGLLHSCFSVAAILRQESAEIQLPFAIRTLRFYQPLAGLEWWCHARQANEKSWDIEILNHLGEVVIEIKGLEVRPATSAAIHRQSEAWRKWLYAVEWQQRPIFGFAPTFYQVLDKINKALLCLGELLSPDEVEQLEARTVQFDTLAIDYILTAFAKSGLTLRRGAKWHTKQIGQQLKVIAPYRRLLGRLLEILAEVGILEREEDSWLVVKTPDIPNLEQLGASNHPAPVDLLLLQRCGKKLGEVLQGVQDPLELLFPGGDIALVTKVYTETPGVDVFNELLRDVVQRLMADLPSKQGIRILEVGAGTGGSTRWLLPHLPAEQTEYVFTDIGAAFTIKAQTTFSDYDFIRYKVLDIEQSPAEQGFALQQYDMVLAANVLHATKDLAETLTHVRHLLKPGGILLLLEGTKANCWSDLTFGLTDGWWRFEDMRTHPLISVTEWQELLAVNGFQTTVPIPPEDNLGQALLVAQAGEQPISTERQWLLFADELGASEALAERLRQRADEVILVRAGTATQKIGEHCFTIRPDHADDYRQLIAALPGVTDVVHGWSLDTPVINGVSDLQMAVHQSCGTTLHLVQALLRERLTSPQLWLLTHGAQAVGRDDRITGFAQSALWGMGKTIALEHPELNCVCIDLDETTELTTQMHTLCAVITSEEVLGKRENQLALRNGGCHVAQLTRYAHVQTDIPLDGGYPLEANATYLITGGLAGLGFEIAPWLVEQGARHLLLIEHNQPTADVQAKVDAMQAMGANVHLVVADVHDKAQVAALLAEVPNDYPLRGIIHAAGVLDDAPLLQQTKKRFDKVLAPKAWSAWHLHSLTQEMPLDFFILFSSIAGLVGNQGQANYAAANAFLDALAYYRQAAGFPALSINWAPWAEVGMPVAFGREESTHLAEHSSGMGLIEPAQGLQLLKTLLKQDVAQVAVLPINWLRYRRLSLDYPSSHFFAHFMPAAPTQGVTQQQQALRTTLASPHEGLADLISYLQNEVAQILRMNEPPPPRRGLFDMGLDSLMAIELRNRLQTNLGISLSSTLFFQYPNIQELAEYLVRQTSSIQDELDIKVPASLRSSSTSYSPLVSIQSAGSKAPFFCVHPWAGLVYPYYDLANTLGSDQPFYGLQSVGMYGQPDRTIEEMATHYIEALRSVTKGPYLLGGWSFGGLVAFEMARQLHRAGDEVALLALFDTWAPLDDKRMSLITSLKFLITMSSRYIWPYVYDYLALVADQAKDVAGAGRSEARNGNGLRHVLTRGFAMAKTVVQEARSLTNSQSTTRRMFSTLESNHQAALNYVPQPYPGRVTLFRVSKQLVPDDQDQTLGWNKLAVGGVEVQMVPGHHLDLLRKPHVQILAAQLATCIDQIQ